MRLLTVMRRDPSERKHLTLVKPHRKRTMLELLFCGSLSSSCSESTLIRSDSADVWYFNCRMQQSDEAKYTETGWRDAGQTQADWMFENPLVNHTFHSNTQRSKEVLHQRATWHRGERAATAWGDRNAVRQRTRPQSFRAAHFSTWTRHSSVMRRSTGTQRRSVHKRSIF